MSKEQNTLHLPMKGFYFNEIKEGRKPWEYRLYNDYWRQRLISRKYDFIKLTLGYPRKGDKERTMIKPYKGYEIQTITHEFFGPDPVKVFAINVGDI